MIEHEHGLIEHKQTPLQCLLPNFILQPCWFFLHSCEIKSGRGLGTRVSTIAGLDYWTGLLDWTTGLDYWTGLLEWTTGLHYSRV